MSVKGYKRPEVTKMSLPSGFLPTFSGGTLNLGDGLTSIALHLTKEITGICEEFAAGTFNDWAEFQARLDPVVESLRFLAFWDPFTRPE